jgi:hypothetical protein
MEYQKSTFKQFKVLIQDHSALIVFESENGVTVSWYDCFDFKLTNSVPICKKLSDEYIRIDTDKNGNITRVEDEFINLPDNEWEMGWY